MLDHISPLIYRLSIYSDTLFNRSVRAEVTKHPQLLTVTIAQANKNPPPRLFPKRLKGHFRAGALNRTCVLRAMQWASKRGEFWVQWKCPVTGELYDGLIVFTHAMTIYYLSACEPACTVSFHDDGYIHSTSEIVKKVRTFVVCLLCTLACSLFVS